MVEFTNLISSMLVTIDTSGDGFIDYNELLAAAEEEPVSAQRPRWRASEVLTHSVFAVQQMLLDAIAAVLPAPVAASKALQLLRKRTSFDWDRLMMLSKFLRSKGHSSHKLPSEPANRSYKTAVHRGDGAEQIDEEQFLAIMPEFLGMGGDKAEQVFIHVQLIVFLGVFHLFNN
eukprot:SAG31_NODE_59_length_29571_cov_20.443506_4_plen_174_part_00